MSHIHVNFKEVRRDNKDINKLANKLNNIERDLDTIRFWISRKIKNRNGIEARLDSAINSIDQLEKQLRTLYAFIEDSVEAYENAEKKINAVKLDGIDEKSWWEKLGEIADVVVDSLKGFGLGVYDAVAATVEGLAYVVTHPIETLEGLAYVITHLDEALPAMWDAIVESWDSQVINGDAESRGKFFGRAFGEVALAVVGTKGVDKVLKGGKIVSNSGKAGKTGKAIDGIKKLSDKTVKVVREAGNGVKVAWNNTKKAIGDIRVPVKVNVAYLRTTNGANIPVGINAETKSVKEFVQNFSVKGKGNLDKTYKRPSGYRKGVRDEVWEKAKDTNGNVRDPLTDTVMNKDEPWDMGHKPGYEFRKHQQSAMERDISRKEFLDEHNNPDHYHPELPSSNRSHKGEDLTDDYFGD